MSKCIAVLTRGYNNNSQYHLLIKRNKHISKNLINKSIDNLIFHEGNISHEQQIYIKNETPELNIIFINILNIAFQSEKNSINFEEAFGFGLGYRHMCSFWFINFFDAVNEYDKVLRIDEDCFMDSNIDDIFSYLDNYLFVTGKIEKDEDFVTVGLNEFSLNFINKIKEESEFIPFQLNSKLPGGPYTNLIGFSLDKIRNNEVFIKYKNEIEKSNMIYKRRWGDLPLWGEVIYYIFGDNSLKIQNSIKYYHGSHNKNINS